MEHQSREVRLSADRSLGWLAIALTAAVACVVGYYPALSIGFLADDFGFLYMAKNRAIGEMMSGWTYFRPLVILISTIDWRLHGGEAFWFHLTNLVWHFAASVGVGVLARLLTRRVGAGVIGAAAFALHPAHPEAVSWVNGRADVIAGALMAWSFVCYVLPDGSPSGRARLLRAASLALFCLACFSKEQAFIFPFWILIYELVRPGDNSDRSESSDRRWLRAVPFFLLAALLFAARWIYLGGVGGYIPVESTGSRILGALYHITLQPFVILFVPLNRTLMAQSGILNAILLVLILLSPIPMALGVRRALLLFCAVGIMLNMLPSIHLEIAEGSLQNSRYLYSASIFFAIMIGAAFSVRFEGRWKNPATILTSVYILAIVLALHQNNYPWQDAGRLVRTSLASTGELVERYRGEWGSEKSRIIAFNVSRNSMGAWTFQYGFPEALRYMYGDELDGVEIEVVRGGVQVPENIRRMDRALEEGAVIWLFDDFTETFAEY